PSPFVTRYQLLGRKNSPIGSRGRTRDNLRPRPGSLRHGMPGAPWFVRPGTSPHAVLQAAAHRLATRALILAGHLDAGDESDWAGYISLISVLTLIVGAVEPERRGQALTTEEMAARLGITSKSLLRMTGEKRITPNIRAGRFLRWSGLERPVGPSRRRAGT